MTALALLRRLHALGVVLTPYPDGTLRYKVPQSPITPAQLDAIRQHQQELHALVEAFEEQAGILEAEAGMPRAEAEALTW